MQPIQLRFTHTEAEYLNAARTMILGEKATILRLAAIFFFLVGLAILLTLLTGVSLPLPIVVLVALLLDAFFAYQLVVEIPRRFFRGDPKMRDEYLLTFSDDGVAVRTHQIDSKLAWSLYTRVLENKAQYIILYGKDARMMTVVPKRVFRDANEELEFRQLLRRHVDQNLTPLNASLGTAIPEYVPTHREPPDWR
jgi:hypothetical protein